jgi:hypothetical protein
VSDANAVNPERKVTVAARFPPALADAVAALADAGDRTLSREVFRAIREHVERSAAPSTSSPRPDAPQRSDGPEVGGSTLSPPEPHEVER